MRAESTVIAGKLHEFRVEPLGQRDCGPVGELPPRRGAPATMMRVELARSAVISGTYPVIWRTPCARKSSAFLLIRAMSSSISGPG